MPISQATYERVALEDPESYWELLCGELVPNERKRGMTQRHGFAIVDLADMLRDQLDRSQFRIRTDELRLHSPSGSNCIPDIAVFPIEVLQRARAQQERWDKLEVHDDPLALVVEVWSPSTGRRDRTTKLGIYQERGDAEIWLVHAIRRTVTAYRRQPDRRYTETRYTDGTVPVASLPNVLIDLAVLFGPT